MLKILGFFLVQLFALIIVYPLWVRRSHKITFRRWLLVTLVASTSSLVLLTVACYVGRFCL
jgi:hypothetical protein